MGNFFLPKLSLRVPIKVRISQIFQLIWSSSGGLRGVECASNELLQGLNPRAVSHIGKKFLDEVDGVKKRDALDARKFRRVLGDIGGQESDSLSSIITLSSAGTQVRKSRPLMMMT